MMVGSLSEVYPSYVLVARTVKHVCYQGWFVCRSLPHIGKTMMSQISNAL